MIECIDAGLMSYEKAFEWQRDLLELCLKDKISDQLILLEHPPVVTLGRRGDLKDIIVSREYLENRGIQVVQTDRGGRATYHGPGQLVGYLIFKVRESVPGFVAKIEESLIRLLRQYHLDGERRKGLPGVWIHGKKIGSIGLRIEKEISRHGFSINITCDLTPFQYINPCGIADCELTSLELELGWRPSMRDVKQQLIQELATVFQTNVSIGIVPTQPE